MARFAVEEVRLRDVFVLRVRGRIDGSSRQELDEALRHAIGSDAPTVVADLAEVESIDNSGLRTLHDAQERFGEAGRRLVFSRERHGAALYSR